MLEAGAQVDRYTLVARLGEGGQAEVWRAMDPLSPGRPVALKLLWLDAAGAADIERARREAHHLARLSHPALPACHALFEDLRRNLLGLVLDFVEGTALDHAVDDPRFTPELALRVVRGLAGALSYLHDEGLVHRDVKPPNALLADSFWADPEAPDAVKLIDLGISVARGNPRPLTVVDQRIGTPPFMPPEQIDPAFWHAAADTPSADVFALGVLAWWLLHRAHPTSLPLSGPLSSFARAYRSIAQSGAPWPPAPLAPWDPFFRLTLALPQSGRAPTASQCVGFLPTAALTWSAPGPNAASATASPLATGAAQPLATGAAQPLGPPLPTATGASSALVTGPAQPLATGPSLATALPATGPTQPLAVGIAAAQPPGTGPALPASEPPPAQARASEIPPTVTEPVPFTADDPLPPEAAVAPLPAAPLVVSSPASIPASSSDAPAAWRLGPRRTLLLGAGLGALLVLALLALLRNLLPARQRPARRRHELER